jgi:hypothetical protein
MTLKIIYYLFLSIVAVGLYHWVYEWFQHNLNYYFSFSKVKKTDKIFQLVENSFNEEEKIKEDGEKGETENIEEKDLFDFINEL